MDMAAVVIEMLEMRCTLLAILRAVSQTVLDDD